jgi:ribonuclease D
MPKPTDLIRDAAGVAEVVDLARSEGRAALDFEFLWERTYAPLACLAQVATRDAVHLIDPIEGAPLGPLAELVSDPDVTVIMHAPSSDLALLELAHGARPANLRDVQITAGFVGMGAGQGLQTLLERGLGVRLDKGERYTDWSRRPLSRRQLEYGAADVEHLMALSDELDRRAAERGREAWVAEEHERRYGPGARFTQDPDEAWRRVKGQGRLSPSDRAVLRALAAWREREALRQNRPVAWLVPDRTLIEIARRRPADRDALSGERGLPDRMRSQEAEGILAAIREGEAARPITQPPAPGRELQQRLDVLGPLAAVLVTARAAAVDLAPTFLATRDEIQAFLTATISGEEDGQPLASGWRAELAGDALRELAAGRLALAADPRRPYLAELPRPAGNARRAEGGRG